MSKNLEYYSPSCKENGIEFGCSVLALFYPGVKIKEGENFTDDQFEYVGELGAGWQKGHLLAKSLGGQNVGANSLPMKQCFNDGTFKSFEVRLKNIVENLSAIQKTVGLTSIYLKYNVEVNSASVKVIKGIAIPTQIRCNVDIYNAIENKPLSKMPIICAFTQLGLDCSVLGNHIFDTDGE